MNNEVLESFRNLPHQARLLIIALFIAVAYFILAKLGLALSTISQNVTLIWPPTGFALVTLLLGGIRYWPAIFIGAFAVNLTSDLSTGAAISIAAGNSLEAIVGYYLLQRFQFHTDLQRVRDVVLLIVLGAGLSTMISASIGTITLLSWDVIAQNQTGVTWLTWWMGDAMGDLFFAPLILVWIRNQEVTTWNKKRYIEAALLVGVTLVTTEVIFGDHIYMLDHRHFPLAFLTFPLLSWAALRFGLRGAATTTMLISAVTLYHVINNEGLFAADSIANRLFLLWLYSNVLAVTSLVLAASVNERMRAEAHIRHLAHHDVLTKLPNRTALQNRIKSQLNESKRLNLQLAIMFIDLDRFKIINDTLGHDVGDLLLEAEAERLSLCIRSNDILARHGGDEFVVVCTDIKDAMELNTIAQRIIDTVSQPYQLSKYELHITPSIGISLFPQDGETVNVLMKNADTAMYQAKKINRSYRYYSTEMSEHAAERLNLESKLRYALENEEFSLFYQPQINLEQNKLVGMEALIRWNNPELGLVMPSTFIPVAEETGLILPIGEWVFREACKQALHWQSNGHQNIRIAVNISARQFWQLNMLENLSNILQETKVDPSSIELEITESMLIGFSEETLHLLEKINSFGLSMSIDDFGMGYSSLSYLKKLPTYKLKIDQSFVRDIISDADDAAITSTIIAMAHNMGMTVVAEGVENKEQLDFLQRQGCDIAQGYYFAKPVSADKCNEIFEEWMA